MSRLEILVSGLLLVAGCSAGSRSGFPGAGSDSGLAETSAPVVSDAAASDALDDQREEDTGVGTCDACSGACPSSLPEAGSSCSCARLCEYGSDPVASCDVVAQCSGPDAGWQVFPGEGDAGGCPTTLAAFCPASRAAAEALASAGTSCDPNDSNIRCYYPDGFCVCDMNEDGSFTWSCPQPPASCPESRPRYGSACQGSSVCSYSVGCSDPPLMYSPLVSCRCGFWAATSPACVYP